MQSAVDLQCSVNGQPELVLHVRESFDACQLRLHLRQGKACETAVTTQCAQNVIAMS